MLDIIYQLLALVGLSTIVLSFIFSIVFLILRQQIHLSIKIGNPRLTRYQRHVAINRDAIMEKVVWYRERGKTWKFIADYLNEKGLKTQQGNTWRADNLYAFSQTYERNKANHKRNEEEAEASKVQS